MVNWNERAAAAQRAITDRHVRRLWQIPATLLGHKQWPGRDPLFRQFDYWWQAHLLDCLIDAALRDGRGAASVRALIRGHLIRNGKLLNDYYDDVAWLGLAYERAHRTLGVRTQRGTERIAQRLRSGWSTDGGGGIWWRVGDDFKNTPANGPAAILFARLGDRAMAEAVTEWLEQTLVDQSTGLVFDGMHPGTGEVEKAIYPYCQGVFLGACLELSTGDDVWRDRAQRTILAVANSSLVEGGVLAGGSGGDGGLFKAILVRYLAMAGVRWRDELALSLVLDSADAAWRNAVDAPGGPLFGPLWTERAIVPTSDEPERDLSVQCGGWMTIEAAAMVSRDGVRRHWS